ncbi:hypothetical protein OG303_33090 [Streptomyces sp. NBC_00005]
MTRGWKITVVVLAVVGIISTPLVWLLNGPDGGQFVGASVQAAAGVGALVWAVRQPTPVSGPRDEVSDSGKSEASDSGTAHTGIRRPGGRGRGWARVKRSGKATAKGPGSKAGTGIDYTP